MILFTFATVLHFGSSLDDVHKQSGVKLHSKRVESTTAVFYDLACVESNCSAEFLKCKGENEDNLDPSILGPPDTLCANMLRCLEAKEGSYAIPGFLCSIRL